MSQHLPPIRISDPAHPSTTRPRRSSRNGQFLGRRPARTRPLHRLLHRDLAGLYAVIAMGGALTAVTGVEILGGADHIVAAVIGMLVVGVMLTIDSAATIDVSGWLSCS